jgi:sulfonate transport system permease protein
VRLWIPVGLVAAWQIAASMRWLDPLFFPSPGRILETAKLLGSTGELGRHTVTTVARVLEAFFIGSAAGVAVGLLMGSAPFWKRSIEPLMNGLNATPKLALLPAFLVLFGLNNTSRLLPAALSCFVLMTIQAASAARAVKPAHIDQARCYGATRRAIYLRIYFPACLPALFTGIRIGLGNALVMVVASEMLGAPAGLGSLIWMTSQTLALDRMYVAIGLCAAIGIVENSIVAAIERRLTPWVS